MHPELKKSLVLGGVLLLIAGSLLASRFGVTQQVGLISAAQPSFLGPPATVGRPNIVFILADDLSWKEMPYLTTIKAYLQDLGTTFRYAITPNALCCPMRSSFLRGQYSHNTGVLTNAQPNGGAEVFKPLESSTLAVWLHDAGYQTALIGKYLNKYGVHTPPHIPPGWDRWVGALSMAKYNYAMFENDIPGHLGGASISYGSSPADYSTTVLTEKALNFIRETRDQGKPFFLYLTPPAPHEPGPGAPGSETQFTGVQAPRGLAFNETDMQDKPQWLQQIYPTPLPDTGDPSIAKIDADFRERLQMMLGVEEMVARVIKELQSDGRLENTYIVFMSDNGYQLGEHRIPKGKGLAYEESIRVPLIIRGPGVGAGQYLDYFIMDHDLTPTFAEIAGAAVPGFMDGKSFRSLLAPGMPNDTLSLNNWRRNFLIENWPTGDAPYPQTYGIRTRAYKYVEYVNGETELYDVQADPYELSNIVVLDPVRAESLIAQYGLRDKVNAMKICAGETCRSNESAAGPLSSTQGDSNGDDRVDILDFNIAVSHFGQTGANILGDVNGDGKVSILDFNDIVSHFGQ
ncbi:MAG: sulfatase-like hydrolase/transferase [Patescibacteria group bacterium]